MKTRYYGRGSQPVGSLWLVSLGLLYGPTEWARGLKLVAISVRRDNLPVKPPSRKRSRIPNYRQFRIGGNTLRFVGGPMGRWFAYGTNESSPPDQELISQTHSVWDSSGKDRIALELERFAKGEINTFCMSFCQSLIPKDGKTYEDQPFLFLWKTEAGVFSHGQGLATDVYDWDRRRAR